jgi:hypothetical protein
LDDVVAERRGENMRKTDREETVYVGARVPAALAAAFERVASSEDRTISAELRRLIRGRVDEAARLIERTDAGEVRVA